MTALSDNSKTVLLAPAIALAHSESADSPGGPPDTGGPGVDWAELIQSYYHHAAPQDLAGREAQDVLGAVRSHLEWARKRSQETAKVRVLTPTRGADGWSASGRSVVEIVTDDMPFLVDSVTMALTELRRTVHTVIHPVLGVPRASDGTLQGVRRGKRAEGNAESWMHIEIDRVGNAADQAGLVERLEAALRDVRVAVNDWQAMSVKAAEIVAELKANPPVLESAAGAEAGADEVSSAIDFLDWLGEDHFAFLGYREYALVDEGDGLELTPVRKSGLGILRAEHGPSRSFSRLPAAVRDRAKEPHLLVLAKANSKATVHRSAYLDYVGVKRFDAAGTVIGERRFLGLLTAAAYTESVQHIPLVKDKVAAVVAALGLDPSSHDTNNVINVLENYPRDELFHTPLDELIEISREIIVGRERRQVRLFTRTDVYARYLSCLVFMPRDRYNTTVREEIVGILKDAYQADSVDYSVLLNESDLAQVHFVVRPPRGQQLATPREPVEPRLEAAARSWRDELAAAISLDREEEDASALLDRYLDAFPETYRNNHSAKEALSDVARIEQLIAQLDERPPAAATDAQDQASIEDRSAIAIDLILANATPGSAEALDARLRIYRVGEPLVLSEVLPRLTSMGVAVVDEQPYRLRNQSVPANIYDFGVRVAAPIPPSQVDNFTQALEAIWGRRNEADGFNTLILAAQLNWREAAVLRAYAGYLKQTASPFSTETMVAALRGNMDITALLVKLFLCRFDPDFGADDAPGAEDRTAAATTLQDKIARALDEVVSLDHDRILRSISSLIGATLRTNFFQRTKRGELLPTIAFKLDPTGVPDLPQPRPRFEIYVYSPRVEGVHLRFGAVARGGLRWSDRRDDFRTEVLGLVKAQMVKNTVIVPVGAKGGFYCKQLPDPAQRDAYWAEGVACYKLFIKSLLDLTDNLVGGEIVAPARVVRHDDDDSYLVVAADKGTATFSDTANAVAAEYGFWLGDAFASGGSVGYDHKAMGITAKGAWESVKRHFREQGINTQAEDFTVVGIGDMSGDVFGNGMLLSEHIRLVAAFDHRDIFLDPDPDAATSFAERQRLFALPRSSWQDYDKGLISAGGGVFSRNAKAVPISAGVRRVLGLGDEVEVLTPSALITAILKAPADLLWNGGIGTYVKSSTEPHSAAGDKANDAIRINGEDLRVRCVGEGGNLGLTQLGRVEFARAGGQICTDFIDNSAGVDTSDHEVNIKILLDRVVADGRLSLKQRNTLLADMTKEVETLVLRDNYQQNVALANAAEHAPTMLHVHEDWIRTLERRGVVDRELEGLPSSAAVRRRLEAGEALTSPELSVVMAWTKIVMAERLLASDLPEDPFTVEDLRAYFPERLWRRYREDIEAHPLRREIIVTQVVNDLVNGAGITYWHRLAGETGADLVELTKANFVAREIFGSLALRQQVEALDNVVPAQLQTLMRLEMRTLVERASRWLVTNYRAPLQSAEVSQFFAGPAKKVMSVLPDLLSGVERESYERRLSRLLGVDQPQMPEALARRVAVLGPSYALLGIITVAKKSGKDPVEVARLHFALGERLGIPALVSRISLLPREDRWQTMARAALRDDLYAVHASLTGQALTAGAGSREVDTIIDKWALVGGDDVAEAAATLADICAEDKPELARLSVGLRVVRSLLTG